MKNSSALSFKYHSTWSNQEFTYFKCAEIDVPGVGTGWYVGLCMYGEKDDNGPQKLNYDMKTSEYCDDWILKVIPGEGSTITYEKVPKVYKKKEVTVHKWVFCEDLGSSATNKDYDYNIIIQDRIREVAHEITEYLKKTDRMAKTIVFCADEDHAERMRSALVNENSDMCKKNPDYVVRITGSDVYGQSKLDYFISVSSKYPVIATTSKLLSTGVDCKMVKLIVLDQNINSMTEFKQMVGRGTRIREKEGKTHFTIMDFRNITRLFADPDWDGPIEVHEQYGQVPRIPYPYPNNITGNMAASVNSPQQPKPVVDKHGCKVVVINKTVSVYDTNGKLLRVEGITENRRPAARKRHRPAGLEARPAHG